MKDALATLLLLAAAALVVWWLAGGGSAAVLPEPGPCRRHHGLLRRPDALAGPHREAVMGGKLVRRGDDFVPAGEVIDVEPVALPWSGWTVPGTWLGRGEFWAEEAVLAAIRHVIRPLVARFRR